MADVLSRAGLFYTNSKIFKYVSNLHVPHDPVLAKTFQAPTLNSMPPHHVAPSDGRLLALLLRLIGARKVLEIGTLAGYSAMHMARELPTDGHLWTIELESKHATIARKNLAEAGLSERCTVLEGAAVDLLPDLEKYGPFDAVFLDADKPNYDFFGRWAARNLRPGGLLLADNAYFFGRLMEDSEEATTIRRFHEEARSYFDTVCILTPDGLLLGIRR
jgi:caffeoyl-CoA O-methyltransferase